MRPPWRPVVQEGDHVTDREIRRLYTRRERDTAFRIHAALSAGDEVRADQLVAESRLGRRDAILVVDRVRPVYSLSQVLTAMAAIEPIKAGDFAKVDEAFEAAGLDADDLALMERLGLLDVYEERAEATAFEGVFGGNMPLAESPVPADCVGSPVTRDDVASRGADHDLSVRLPDGTDYRDREVRDKAEERVRAWQGPHAVVMWPRTSRDVEDGLDPEIPVVNARAGASEVPLGTAARPTDWQQVAVAGERQGLGALVEYDPYGRTATFASLAPETKAIRDRLAVMLRAQPHEIEIACHYVPDERPGSQRLDQVVVLRTPVVGVAAERRLATWRELVLTLPGGSAGWEIIEDPVSGLVRLRYGQPRTLPKLTPMPDLLPDRLMPQEWARIPLGVTPSGSAAFIDLAAGPHGLVVGPTGTGKTVALLQWAVAALVRGHRLLVVDPTKAGLDFLSVRSWCAAWADTLEQGQVVIQAVYAEVGRRKAILQQFECVKWSDLPPEVRRDHDVHPTTVIIDEYGSLVLEEQVPKSLPKDSEFRIEAEQRNVARAIIAGTVGRIAREARFAGIHLVVALQRPDASIISGELRANLTSAVQLAAPGKPVSLDALRMVLPGDVAGQAAAVLTELDDGRSRGLAVMAAEGGSAIGLRVAYGAPSEIPNLLEEVGVQKPFPWSVGKHATSADPEPVAGEIIRCGPVQVTPNPEGTVKDLGEIELTIDDLDLEEEEALGEFADDDFASEATTANIARAETEDEFRGPPSRTPEQQEIEAMFT